MSRIHHTQRQKAEKIGVQLEESGQFIRAYWPMRNIAVFGVDARWAIEQMEAAQRLIRYAEDRGSELTIRTSFDQPTMVHLVIDGAEPTIEKNAPMVWWNQAASLVFADEEAKGPKPYSASIEPMVAIKVVGPNGEPLDEDAEQLLAQDTEEEVLPARSVVKPKYRAIYAEAGHPAHCGDEMAEKLNNLVNNGKGTNIEFFQMILTANEIDMSKYKTTGNGWQGRYRMTGRNVLSRKVYANGGVLKLPSGETLQMSGDWMSLQRFKV